MELFPFLGTKFDDLHIKDCLEYDCELYLSNLWLHSNARSLLLIAPWIIDLPLKLDGGQLFLSLEIILPLLLLQYNGWKQGTLCVGLPLYNSIRDRFQSLFETVVSRSFKSFFQLEHQVDISCLSHRDYCTLLSHFRKVAGLTPFWCAFSPITLLASWSLISISFHLQKKTRLLRGVDLLVINLHQ